MFALGHRSAAVALLLVSILLFGGLVHAVVPHHHGDDHGGSAPEIWTDLHASLSHDDKKALFILADSFVLSVFAFVMFAISSTFDISDILAVDPVRGSALRRGVIPHRSFR